MYSGVQQPCKFAGRKESVYIREELICHRIGLVHQDGGSFIVLEQQYGCHVVMCIRSILSSWLSHPWDIKVNHSNGDLFTSDNNILFSRLRTKAHLVFHCDWLRASQFIVNFQFALQCTCNESCVSIVISKRLP